ncbi:Pumilio homolog 12 [Linum perenne]
MFPRPNGSSSQNSIAGDQLAFSSSSVAAASNLRYLDQAYPLYPPPPPYAAAAGYTLTDHSQFPYHHPQESLESLFSSLDISSRRRFDGFFDGNAEVRRFLPGGGAAGNHLSIGLHPNYGDQARPLGFNYDTARANNFQSNSVAANGGGVVLPPAEWRDYIFRLISEDENRLSLSRTDYPATRANPRRSSSNFPNRRSHHNHHSSSNGFNGSISTRSCDLAAETLNSLESLRGKILSLAQDQSGCRLLQRIIGTKKVEEIGYVFSELIDHIGQLMLDQLGNYVVQKLIEVCSDEQRTQILITLTRNEIQLQNICLSTCGSRAVQKLLDHVNSSKQVAIIMPALSRAVVPLAKDMNAHHVIQYCVKSFTHEDNKYLLNKVADNCFEIATDKSGCCVIQVCVEYSRGETRDRLVSEIIGNALHLSQDCYGNYVVQNIVGLKIREINAALLAQLQGDLVNLSCNKYGSNVVEKCLTETTVEQATQVMMELLSSPKCSLMLVDPFGNFVIQTALEISQLHHNVIVQSALEQLVRRNYPMMRSNIYGKKVINWFGKRLWLHM